MPRQERCRAQVKERCRKHGAQERLRQALKNHDLVLAHFAQTEISALAKSNWHESGESEWGFIRPANRPLTGPDDVKALLASEDVLADAYEITFELGGEYAGKIRRYAKKHGLLDGVSIAEDQSKRLHLIAHNKQELHAVDRIFVYLNNEITDRNEQAAGLRA